MSSSSTTSRTLRFALRKALEREGYRVTEAASCEEARAAAAGAVADVAVLDYALPDGDALELLAQLRGIDAALPIVILTGHGTIDLAVRAIQEGADQFLTKPVEVPALLVLVGRLLEGRRSRRLEQARSSRDARRAFDPFIGSSAAIRELESQVRPLLDSDSPIMIEGETGTGKGVLAEWLHRNGPRAAEAFVDINCAGLSRELVESELFGHEKGAPTGASSAKAGLLEAAHRGTAFLDEIGDVDPQVQPKLLKVLEEKRLRRLGEVRDRAVDVRLVVATHHDMASAVREGRFRSDLYYRINTLPVRLPALRERGEDIPLLAGQILTALGARRGRTLRLSEAALQAMAGYAWPGNIRELRNVLERATLLAKGDTVTPRELRFEPGAAPAAAPGEPGRAADPDTPTSLEAVVRQHIERAFEAADQNVERAAVALEVPRSSLYEKLKRYGLLPTRRKRATP